MVLRVSRFSIETIFVLENAFFIELYFHKVSLRLFFFFNESYTG